MNFRRIVFSLAIVAGAATPLGVASADQYEVLLAQPPSEQKRILRAAINSAGEPCSAVTLTLFKGADREAAGYWAAACADGGNWIVRVGNDRGGRMSVLSCAFAARLDIACWEKF